MLKVIEVGEKVRVIANGHTYSTHLRALRRLGVSKDRLPSLENGEEATVVGYTYIENRENDTFAYLYTLQLVTLRMKTNKSRRLKDRLKVNHHYHDSLSDGNLKWKKRRYERTI